MNKKLKTVFFALLLLALVVAFLNFQSLKDFFVSFTFAPSPEISAIENNLQLTSHGKTLFRASTPKLEQNDEFNTSCKTSFVESSVLGCYTNGKIHVFHVESAEFPGILESITAHELLHASWARFSESERENLTPLLESVFAAAPAEFQSTLDTYSDSEKLEEIYVRSATQLKSLPAELEAHFATIFLDQDSVVDFYDSYIAPFSALESALSSLSAELDAIEAEIDALSAEYDTRTTQFSAAVAEFNDCASTINCFSSYTFTTRRNELLAEQSALESLYLTLESKVAVYNEKANIYNSKVIYGQQLQNLINPNQKLKESL